MNVALNIDALGDTADPDSIQFQTARRVSTVEAQRAARMRALTPAQRAAAVASVTKITTAAQKYARRRSALLKTVVPGYTVAGPAATLGPIDKEFQRMVLARDWNALFTFLPAGRWGGGMLGKYSFIDTPGGTRRYVPFTKADLRSWIFSKGYTVQPGYTCTDAQRDLGVAAHWKAQQRHKQKFTSANWQYVWPIYPARGYGKQRFGCEKPVRSTWVKIRKPLAIAAVVAVGGIILGKALVAKAATASAAKATAAGAATAVTAGGGTAASLATAAGTTAALSTGAGTAAAAAAAAGGVVTGATSAGGIVGFAARAAPMATNIINGTRTIKALADGELPPPPISLGDGSLTDYATLVGNQLAERELGRKLKAAEAEMMRQMIDDERRYLARAEQPHQPVVNSGLNPALTAAQRTRADAAVSEGGLIKMLAIGVPVGILLMRGG